MKKTIRTNWSGAVIRRLLMWQSRKRSSDELEDAEADETDRLSLQGKDAAEEG